MKMFYFSLIICSLISVGFSDDGCVKCMKPNEHFDCGPPCERTCKTPDPVCPWVNKKCTEKCYCDDGYTRDKFDNCIPIHRCPGPEIECKKPNEVYNCGSACQTTCATLGEICQIVNVKCNDVCYCIDDYARNSKGLCIPIKDCKPGYCKRRHEHYGCGSPCQPTCETLGDACNKTNNNATCTTGCFCDKGFVRDRPGKCGKCIPIQSCPQYECNDGPNEEFGCGPYDRECSSIKEGCDSTARACEKEKKCYPGCYCRPGFARNEYKQCVPIEDSRASESSDSE